MRTKSIVMLPLLLVVSASSMAAMTDENCKIPSLRRDYAKATLAVADSVNTQIGEANDVAEIDLEEQGCISDYGLKGGFGLPSLASGLLDGLMDKVCSAADDYIASNLDKFSASLTTPLNVADVDLGLGKREPGEPLIDTSTSESELGVDFDSMIDDQFKRLPKVDSGYGDYSYDAGADVKDYDYGTKDAVSGGRR